MPSDRATATISLALIGISLSAFGGAVHERNRMTRDLNQNTGIQLLSLNEVRGVTSTEIENGKIFNAPPEPGSITREGRCGLRINDQTTLYFIRPGTDLGLDLDCNKLRRAMQLGVNNYRQIMMEFQLGIRR